MSIRTLLQSGLVYLDGGLGTLLQAAGLRPGEFPEQWNLTHPETVIRIHKEYFDAGSNIVCANTFGANSLKYSEAELEEIIKAAIQNARAGAAQSASGSEKYVALDVGPLGKLLQPYGTLAFEDAVACFAKTVRLGVKYGADLIFIETMSDSYETKAAVLAAKENSSLPVFATNAYSENGKLLTGASPAAMAAMLEGLGVDALGINCSYGPRQMRGIVEGLLEFASVPVIVKANAGLPVSKDGRISYDIDADEFSDEIVEMVHMGVSLIGGCCGTTAEYIRKCVEKTRNLTSPQRIVKERTLVSSYTHVVEIGSPPTLIGERINPTGKKRFKQALMEQDMDYILQEGLEQQKKGAQILDVNVGLPGIDEPETLTRVVKELQAICDLPLQLDTSSTEAMAQALRCYNGKAMVNSVSGKAESLKAILPLVKKYGGVVVALLLDEDGIPDTVEGRLAIAKKILSAAESYGIRRKDIVFDPLCMAVSADSGAAKTVLETLRALRGMGLHTVLGISNVSFGLPLRDIVNANFLALALENGLSAAIVNPHSAEIQKAYYAYRLLHGEDEHCEAYIRFADALSRELAAAPAASPDSSTAANKPEAYSSSLQEAIINGLKERAAQACRALLEHMAPMEIINRHIVPALDTVGKGFEANTLYLPQLLMSADACKYAFEEIKAHLAANGNAQPHRIKFVIATVKGDIHDIGKNIVKVLLENYGFKVIDLGKDVAPEAIVEAVLQEQAPVCGLSALMTTTVPAMEETIRQLKKAAPFCRVIVGGAVLTQEYADRIGADKYAKDAMEAVRYAEEVEGMLNKAGS